MKRTPKHKHTRGAWWVLILGLALTAAATVWVRQVVTQNANRIFAQTSDQMTLHIRDHLVAQEVALRAGSALFAVNGQVSRTQWRHFWEAQRTDLTVPGIQGFGFAQSIPASELSAHEALVRAEGYPAYKVFPPGKRELYSSIVFLEPFKERNLRAFGFDMFSEPVRRAAMERARDTGHASLTGRVELVQEDGREVQAGVLMYLPVYKKNASLKRIQDRQNALLGWVYSPYRMDDLMRGILMEWRDELGKAIHLTIYDGHQAMPEQLLYSSQPDRKDPNTSASSQIRTLESHGRRWLLVFDHEASVSGVAFIAVWLTLGGGVLVSGLLYWLMLSLLHTRQKAHSIAAQLTERIRRHEQALEQSNARLEKMVAERTSELARANEDLRHLARRDALTGLPNRFAANERLRMEFVRLQRSSQSYAIVLIDVDHFKQVNDRFGHAVGDQVLQAVGQTLLDQLRENDFVARYGGEEFIVLLPNTPESGALAVANKLRRAVADRPNAIAGALTISIGVAMAERDHANEEQAVVVADKRLYEAKNGGRNRVVGSGSATADISTSIPDTRPKGSESA